MTQCLREMLDAAVSHVEPREVDPVPLVLRRARGRRTWAVTAGALTVTVLAAAGAMMSWPTLLTPGEKPIARPVSEPPPTPRLADGEIVAGGIRIPVPAGWTVNSGPTGCPDLTGDFVLLAGPDDIGCTTAPIEVRSRPAATAIARRGADLVESWPPLSRASMVTLAGGEPGWLTHYPSMALNEETRPSSSVLWLPWSQLTITMRLDDEAQQGFLRSIRSAPRHAGRLVIGTRAAWAALIVDGRAPGKMTEDSQATGTVIALLERQEAVRDSRRACAAPEHPTAVLILESSWARGERLTTIIVMTLAPQCREAVSAEGGRVTLSPQAYEELMRLFGNAAQ